MLYNRFAKRIMKNTKLKLVQTSTPLKILAFPQKNMNLLTLIDLKTKKCSYITISSFSSIPHSIHRPPYYEKLKS